MLQAVILAAGGSSRFWPLSEGRHKSLLKIMGKPIIQWTVEGLYDSKIRDVIILQSPKKDIEAELGDKVGKARITYVVQKEPLGMGNALLQAKDHLEDRFFVFNPNHFFAEEPIEKMAAKMKKTGADMVLLGSETDRPWDYGMLGMEGDKAVDLVEKPEKGKEPSNVKAAGIYLLCREFFDFYRKVKEHQYSYEDALKLCMKELDVRVEMSGKEAPSLKYPWDLFRLSKLLMDGKIKRQRISSSAKMAKNAIIEGKVLIGSNTVVYENAVIKGPCYIGNSCTIGNMSLVRSCSDLEDNVSVGTHSEVKNCILQEGASFHSGFLGDSIFGRGCRIGAGTITANRRLDREEIVCVVKGEEVGTGMTFLGSMAGENTRFGIGAKLMPGTLIGSDCVIGAGSVVGKNIESGTVFYTRFEEVIKKRDEKT